MNSRFRLPPISISRLILLTALVFTLFYNFAFFRNVTTVYGNDLNGILFVLSLGLFLFSTTVLVLSVLCFRYFTKPVLITVILGAAGASYFMNRFNIVIDTTMVTNILQTDTREAGDLVTLTLVLDMFLFGVLPAFLIYRTPITCRSFGKEITHRLKLGTVALVLLVLSVVPFSSYYTSFFREHKILRYYANPTTFIYSSGKLVEMALASTEDQMRQPLGMDARIPPNDLDRELIILVIGEAARADHFALNGYQRPTTPRLQHENVISFSNVLSCGTATAFSLPCMFSLDKRTDFDLDDAGQHENLLDVLNHAGVQVLWRDNNSDSKGVADALNYEDFKSPALNPACDIECRDIGMLDGLDAWIASHPEGDLTIILHQMGNHGPAYYKRYPDEFALFSPVCSTNELGDCSDVEINNAYDNAILYTDYFLGEVINFLKPYDDSFETAMYYMSDHGESLGENGLYLHGLPYLLAPDTQKNVASIMWFGTSYAVNHAAVAARTDDKLSHDNYFHTVLGLMEIDSSVYEPSMDLIVHH